MWSGRVNTKVTERTCTRTYTHRDNDLSTITGIWKNSIWLEACHVFCFHPDVSWRLILLYAPLAYRECKSMRPVCSLRVDVVAPSCRFLVVFRILDFFNWQCSFLKHMILVSFSSFQEYLIFLTDSALLQYLYSALYNNYSKHFTL
jgi:hypothetical protein